MTKPRIVLALNTYDRHEPPLEGAPEHPVLELAVTEVNQSSRGRYGSERHERFLPAFEFDVCELSLSSYLVAVGRGLPVRAIPAFPRCLGKRLRAQPSKPRLVHRTDARPRPRLGGHASPQPGPGDDRMDPLSLGAGAKQAGLDWEALPISIRLYRVE